jgi:hypothetical protein
MNPLVSVVAEPGSTSDTIPDDLLLDKYDVVFLGELGPAGLHGVAQLEAACSRLGKQLFVGAVRGPNAFLYLNLQRHAYTLKVGPAAPLPLRAWGPGRGWRRAATAPRGLREAGLQAAPSAGPVQ